MEAGKNDSHLNRVIHKASFIYLIEDEIDVFDPQQLFILSGFMNGDKGSQQ
jgi:hypothetical protein